MKTVRILMLAALVAAVGCGPGDEAAAPVTDVNAPRPTNIVTNIPPAN